MVLEPFVHTAIAQTRRAPVDLSLLPADGVPASLFSGAAGVAFFLYEAARLRGGDELVDRAHDWTQAGRRWADRAAPSDYKGSANGFLVGAVGLAFVEALVAARRGDTAEFERALDRIDRASTSPRGFLPGVRRTELFGGSAGILCAAAGLHARLDTPTTRRLLERVHERGVAAIDRAVEADRLGMAHGLAGELWALLTVLDPDHEIVRSRLAGHRRHSEADVHGLVYWAARAHAGRSAGDMSHVVTFCNGVPGHGLLLTELARRTRRARDVDAARRALASVAVLAGGGPSLCCGLAGQSVVLDRGADLLGDAGLRRRALACITRAARARQPLTRLKTPLALFQGGLGVVLVAMSRLAGERAFPCLEPPLSARLARIER